MVIYSWSLAPPSRLFLRCCEERQLLVYYLAEHGISRGATEKMAVNEKARRAGQSQFLPLLLILFDRYCGVAGIQSLIELGSVEF